MSVRELCARALLAPSAWLAVGIFGGAMVWFFIIVLLNITP